MVKSFAIATVLLASTFAHASYDCFVNGAKQETPNVYDQLLARDTVEETGTKLLLEIKDAVIFARAQNGSVQVSVTSRNSSRPQIYSLASMRGQQIFLLDGHTNTSIVCIQK